MLQQKLQNFPQDFRPAQPSQAAAGVAGVAGVTEKSTRAAQVERRAVSRVPVIKSAKILCGEGASQSIYNCLILDESATGVLADLGTLVPLADEATLQMNGGPTYLVRRRWAVGTKAGLEFIGGQIISEETATRMKKIADLLQSQGVPAAVCTLRGARFFEYEELRRAAEDTEAAFRRLEALLNGK